jgi:hypothetical protein
LFAGLSLAAQGGLPEAVSKAWVSQAGFPAFPLGYKKEFLVFAAAGTNTGGK